MKWICDNGHKAILECTTECFDTGKVRWTGDTITVRWPHGSLGEEPTEC